jgi:hypothetical protein
MLRHRFELVLMAATTTLLSSAPAHAETAREQGGRGEKALTITTNLIAPFFGVYPLEANVRVSPRLAVVVNGSHFSLQSGAWQSSITAMGAGVSYHLEGTALRKWYIEAIAEALLASWHHDANSDRTSPLAIGSSLSVLAGYRFVWKAGPVLDLGLGIARIHVPSGTAEVAGESAASGDVTRFYPAPKLNVGWAF